MQVTETLAEGLKREYQVVLAAADLSTRLESELTDLQAKARINGFRPGKVPVAHLKRLYGRSIMAEVMQTALNEANRKIIEDNDLRLAGSPQIVDLPQDEASLMQTFEKKADFSYKVAVEVLPKFDIGSFEDIAVERLVVDVSDAEVDALVARLAEQNRTFAPKEGEDAVAAKGDKATIDFVGKLGDEAFEGGTAQDADLVLGSGSFIPGFEEQLEGMKIGESRRLIIPAELAYGDSGAGGVIPPGAALVFDVDLIAIE